MLFYRWDILCIGLVIFRMEEIFVTISVAMITFFCSIEYFFSLWCLHYGYGLIKTNLNCSYCFMRKGVILR